MEICIVHNNYYTVHRHVSQADWIRAPQENPVERNGRTRWVPCTISLNTKLRHLNRSGIQIAPCYLQLCGSEYGLLSGEGIMQHLQKQKAKSTSNSIHAFAIFYSFFCRVWKKRAKQKLVYYLRKRNAKFIAKINPWCLLIAVLIYSLA